MAKEKKIQAKDCKCCKCGKQAAAFFPAFDHEDPTDRVDRGYELAQKAISLDESFALSYCALGSVHLMRKEHDAAVKAGQLAVDRQPSDAEAYSRLAVFHGFNGDWQQAADACDVARRLNPLFVNGPYLNIKHMSLAVCGRYSASIEAFEENLQAGGPVGPPALVFAAASYHALGRAEDAERCRSQLEAGFPAFRLRGWNYTKLIRNEFNRDQVIAHMQAAGIPH